MFPCLEVLFFKFGQSLFVAFLIEQLLKVKTVWNDGVHKRLVTHVALLLHLGKVSPGKKNPVQIQRIGRLVGYRGELDLPFVADQLTGYCDDEIQVDLAVPLRHLFALCHDGDFGELHLGNVFTRNAVFRGLGHDMLLPFVIRPCYLPGQTEAGICDRFFHLRLGNAYTCQLVVRNT